jgi:heme/copper-type cytochrome/quinol oxidase subunit 2
MSLLMLSGCGLGGPQSTLTPDGPVAHMQREVFLITLYVSAGIFLATGGLLIYAVWRFRAQSETDAAPLSQSHGNPKIELTLIAVVSLLLLVIAVPNIRALFAASQPPVAGEVLRVEVTAGQWWWKFEYPELGLVTANELHIPVGRGVQARLRSADVIHSIFRSTPLLSTTFPCPGSRATAANRSVSQRAAGCCMHRLSGQKPISTSRLTGSWSIYSERFGRRQAMPRCHRM